MNALTLLLKEHESHRNLLNEIPTNLTKFSLLREVIYHVNMEEDVFYPCLLKNKKIEMVVKEAWEEHSILMQLFQEMDELEKGPKDWTAKFEVFKKLMLLHLDTEEPNLFPKINNLATNDFLEEVGKEMLNHKKHTNPEEVLYPDKKE